MKPETACSCGGDGPLVFLGSRCGYGVFFRGCGDDEAGNARHGGGEAGNGLRGDDEEGNARRGGGGVRNGAHALPRVLCCGFCSCGLVLHVCGEGASGDDGEVYILLLHVLLRGLPLRVFLGYDSDDGGTCGALSGRGVPDCGYDFHVLRDDGDCQNVNEGVSREELPPSEMP